MHRPPLAFAIALLVGGAPLAAAGETPAPRPTHSPKMVRHTPAFSSSLRPAAAGHVPASACSQRAAGSMSSSGSLGPNGPSTSKTLVAVPLGGGSVKSATTRQQISEACAH